ncbi:MAG: group 1 truncated hemoglobin [Comamonadaceae bacterium]|nr:MAG: group 1 truncated hemoglobin [Comamonadaceae bacterium]
MRSLLSFLGAAAAPVAVLTALCMAPAYAQQAPAAPAPAANGADRAGMTRPAPEGLYQALGEKAGIARLMDDLVTRAVADPRIGHIFKDTKVQALKDSLTLQVCLLSGGPCVYEGDNMKAAHADFAITKGDFNRLVELLQSAMDAQNIPFTQQNRLLALLAPMHGDIITRR